jgi:hypothetical protein
VYSSIFTVRVLLCIFGMCLCSIHELIETSRYYIYTSTIIVRFLVLFGCIDVQYLNIALVLNTETTLNQNILFFILWLDLLKTYCWSYRFDLLIFIHHYLYTCVILPSFLFYCYFTFAPLNVDFSYIQRYLPEVDAASEIWNDKS